MSKLVPNFYKTLMLLACLSMVAAFGTIMLGVVARLARWDIPGLDGYAGFSIAAALFLALPQTFRHGDHIRVTLILDKLPARARAAMEFGCLTAGLALSLCLAWFACRIVWISYITHDVSASADATPLWIPQLSMALGCLGFAVAFADAFLARLGTRQFFTVNAGAELARVE
jgi:TRAP-type C4-dicarboxylate transport system permease small subunit